MKSKLILNILIILCVNKSKAFDLQIKNIEKTCNNASSRLVLIDNSISCGVYNYNKTATNILRILEFNTFLNNQLQSSNRELTENETKSIRLFQTILNQFKSIHSDFLK